jgi:DnaJ-class molecular chaperone
MTSHICHDCSVPGDGKCRRCHGEGKITSQKSFGEFPAELRCPRCKGTGDCPTCSGTGHSEVGGESG